MGIDEYFKDIFATLFKRFDGFMCETSVKITGQFQVKAVSELEILLVRQYSSNSAYIFGIFGTPRFANLFKPEKHWVIYSVDCIIDRIMVYPQSL
jgi:hypothetical protein